MTIDQIETSVREILNRQIQILGIENSPDDSDIVNVLGSDLLEFVKALMAIEERFNMEFAHDTPVESITIKSIVAHIEKCHKLAA